MTLTNSVSAVVLVGAVAAALYKFHTSKGAKAASRGRAVNVSPATVEQPGSVVYPPSVPSDDKQLFEMMFDFLLNEIIYDMRELYELNDEALQWIDRMTKYSVQGGKMNRGLATLSVHKTLAAARGETLTPAQLCRAAALGWCVEWLQAFFLVADDIMDASVTRRGQPCWYKNPDVQLIAINDSFILESCVFKILKKHFGHEPYYVQLVDLFLECTRQTELGQLLDLTTQSLDGNIDLRRFTIERYRKIVKYKTAFYSFYLPVALSMITSGITEKAVFDQAREILCIMGEYFQVQDDYLDCYGDPTHIGKIGTDIQDNKCSWLVVQALNRATPLQRTVLESNYGRHDLECVERVKALYREMDLESVYRQYEDTSYAQLQVLLTHVVQVPREVFEFLLKKIYKRDK